RGRRKHELAAGGVALGVGNDEAVAGEYGPGCRDGQAVMGACVSLREEAVQGTHAVHHLLAALELPQALAPDPQALTIRRPRVLPPVASLRSLYELAGIEHVTRTPRMQQRRRARQLTHQEPGPTGMVEMHMRQKDVIDVARVDVFLLQSLEQQ